MLGHVYEVHQQMGLGYSVFLSSTTKMKTAFDENKFIVIIMMTTTKFFEFLSK